MVFPGKGWPVRGSRTARREAPGALVGRGHAGEARHPAGDAGPLVVHEEEGLVLDDGPAEVAPELLLVVRRLGRSRALREEVVRVHVLVAVEAVGRAVDLVGPRLRGDAHRRPRRPAVLRGVRARDDLELLDGVHRGTRDLACQLLDVGGDAVVVHPVEQEVVLEGAGPVDVHPARAAEGGAAALLGEAVALHAGDEGEQVVPVADGEGQLGHRVLVDDRPQRGLSSVEQARRFVDRDRFGQGAHPEGEIDACSLPDLEDHGLGALLVSPGPPPRPGVGRGSGSPRDSCPRSWS